jgi:hypothetical protein
MSVAEFYHKSRAVRFIYEDDELLPVGTRGVTKGFPSVELIGPDWIELINVDFGERGRYDVGLVDIEFVED